MDAAVLLQRVITNPSSADLLALQAALLALEESPESEQHRREVVAALEVLGDFYSYMVDLEGKLEARTFAELASKLDIAAVGGVVLENIVDAGEKMTERILIGGLSEALMVLASRQYVKAYRRELEALHRQAAWRARAHLWRFSRSRRPNLSPENRNVLVDAYLLPVFNNSIPGEVKSILLGLLFQVLILCCVTACLVEREKE